jgi:glucose-1-phosphate cytidylyltransferase
LGYRGEDIKRFFVDFVSLSGDLTVRVADRMVDRLATVSDDWTVHLIDTGLDTNTGGRIGRLAPWLSDDRFMLTYGDGVSNVNLAELLATHDGSGNLATITAVRPNSRFGGLSFEASGHVRFIEKPQIGEGWVSGGFMVVEPEVLSLVRDDNTSFERHVLEEISEGGRLGAYRHEDFWQSMDTIRDVRYLRDLWAANDAPWKTWH